MVPIILAGAAIGSAGVGLKKMFDASDNKTKAKNMITDALNCAEYVARDSLRQRKETNQRLSDLGRLRATCVTELMTRYVLAFKQIKCITYKQPEMKNFRIETQVYNAKKIEDISVDTATFVANSLASMSAGAAAGYGAYGMATYIGAASTGTALSALSGAAATNATLAWFGGGALSAGGMGMAGGSAVLGGVVAGPALLVMGLLAAKKAEEQFTYAVKQEAEIRLGIEQLHNGIAKAKAIETRAKEMHSVIYKVAHLFADEIVCTEAIIEQKKAAAIEMVNNAEAVYKKKNVITRFFNWLFGKSPKFDAYRKDPSTIPDKFIQQIYNGVDPLNFNNFTAEEKNKFQIFTVMGVHMHRLLKAHIMDEHGGIDDNSEIVIQETCNLLQENQSS
jgi:hypothetical protein